MWDRNGGINPTRASVDRMFSMLDVKCLCVMLSRDLSTVVEIWIIPSEHLRYVSKAKYLCRIRQKKAEIGGLKYKSMDNTENMFVKLLYVNIESTSSSKI